MKILITKKKKIINKNNEKIDFFLNIIKKYKHIINCKII